MQINLLQYAPIQRWKPEVGDQVFWHGWLTHWFGVVCDIKADEITVIKKGMPKLMVTLSQSEQDKNKETISLAKIHSGGSFWHGEYAALKTIANNHVWFV